VADHLLGKKWLAREICYDEPKNLEYLQFRRTLFGSPSTSRYAFFHDDVFLVKAMRAMAGRWHSMELSLAYVLSNCAGSGRARCFGFRKSIKPGFHDKARGAVSLQ
jgi:hypothetical protein